MKKKLLLAIPSLLIGTLGMSQLSNGDLEMWQDVELYQDFSSWSSSRAEGDTALSNRSTDAFDGTYSAILTTDTIEGDTTFGFVINGQFGDSGPESGVPYTGPGLPDSIIFWAKYDIETGDSAVVLVVPFSGGTPVGLNEIKYGGTNTGSWERKAYELDPTLAVDEILVAFASSNALIEYGIPGSYVMIDRVEIKTNTGATFLLPNHSFEDWDTVSVEEPVDWYGNLLYDGDTTLFKTTDAFSNTYAARLLTKESPFGDTITGYLSNGFTDGSEWFMPQPYTQMPTSLDFYVKHNPSGADTAEVNIEFFEAGAYVGGVYYRIDTAINTYKQISLPINYNVGAAPDSMRLIFSSGRNAGSELFIDQIELIDPTVSVNASTKELINVYPNPAVNQITFDVPSNSTIKVYSTEGRLVNQVIANNTYMMNISNLKSGIYIYQVNAGDKVYKGKFIKK